MQNLSKELPSFTATRIHRNFPPEWIGETAATFGGLSSRKSPVLIVSHDIYEYKEKLAAAVAKQQDQGKYIEVVFSAVQNPEGKVDNASLLNIGLRQAVKRGFTYVNYVSSDLGEQLPQFRKQALERLHDNHRILVVGASIEGVHDMQLIDKVLREGQGAVHTGNYAAAFPSNAMASYRIGPLTSGGRVSIDDQLFRQRFEEDLGFAQIGTEQVPLRGHEDMELPLRLLAQGKIVEVVLFTGHGIRRDSAQEVPTRDYKYQTRQQVVDGYKSLDRLSDGELKEFLDNHFHIENVKANTN